MRRKINVLYVLSVMLLLCCGALWASPRLPAAMSWAGTKELASGAADSALAAVKADVSGSVADSLLRLLKLGAVHIHLRDTAAAKAAFDAAARGCPALAPLALEQLGDIAAASEDHSRAMTEYSSALQATGLPAAYRQHLFGKVRRLNRRGVSLPAGASWIDEYRRWERAQRLFDAAGLEAICDSLVNIGRYAEADSLLELHLPKLSRRDQCGIVSRMFEKRTADPKVTTRFLFSLATQASNCQNYTLAERILGQAQARPDFSTAVQARQFLLLQAQIANGQQQWQRAIELYTRLNTAHGPDQEAIMTIARAYRRLGNEAQAQTWNDLHIRHFPAHRHSQEILWLRAWNHESAGRFRDAAAGYRRVLSTQGRRTEEAHYRRALCHYKLGQHDSVIIHLAAFQRQFPNSSYLWAGMFWQGKSHAALGRTAEAHKIWNNVIRLDPTDYHAHRAKQLMGTDTGQGSLKASPFAAQMTDAQARTWLNSVSPSSRRSLNAADTMHLRRGAALLSIARPELANFFLDDYERNYSGNLQLQYEMAAGYALAGDYARSFRVARRLAWRIPMEHRSRMPLQVLTILYPPFYSTTITRYAERFNVDPLFVSAVMRQESMFDKGIVSPAGAIGLMQIMPATGQTIARELRVPYTVDSLYSAAYNIKFGAYYLRKRLTQFNGDKVLALCSYNAGPGNAVRWRDRNRGIGQDMFNENIGFQETRIYVKKVMGNYWTYKMLAATPGYDYDLPLTATIATAIDMEEVEEYPWVNDW